MGTPEEVEETMHMLLAGNESALISYEAKKRTIDPEQFIPLMRRLILQITDNFWLEQLETMEYLRRSVSLRAYGQRDPLIEYRREGLIRFRQMEGDIALAVGDALPHAAPSDEARIRAEEEKVRAQLVLAGKEGDDSPQAPIVKGDTHGRNDLVTIKKGDATQTLKYKKAETLLSQGWEIAE
jgi:preprotein translocase subunit SecA